jgi:hypothetical protein
MFFPHFVCPRELNQFPLSTANSIASSAPARILLVLCRGRKWNQQKSRRPFLLGVVPDAVRKCYSEFPEIGRLIFSERTSVRGVHTG